MAQEESALIKVIKTALTRMDRKFTDLSRLEFDEISKKLREKLEEQKIQERPFAYEFYHQLRKMYENRELSNIVPEEVVIQAEVNKCYQGIPNLDRIPDFLLHKPNSMEKNLAVIEFKVASRKDVKSEIIKDFEKLTAFQRELGYKYLIEVIIGNEKFLNNCRTVYEHYKNIPKSEYNVEIIVIEFNTDKWEANHIKIRFQ